MTEISRENLERYCHDAKLQSRIHWAMGGGFLNALIQNHTPYGIDGTKAEFLFSQHQARFRILYTGIPLAMSSFEGLFTKMPSAPATLEQAHAAFNFAYNLYDPALPEGEKNRTAIAEGAETLGFRVEENAAIFDDDMCYVLLEGLIEADRKLYNLYKAKSKGRVP